MLIIPKKRKILRLKTMKEIGLDENKLQVEIPFLGITKTINLDSIFANCNIFDPTQLNFYDLTI